MMTSKQRAYLKSLANGLTPVFQVGKGGVGDALCVQVEDYLRVHELMKISVLDSAFADAGEIAREIAGKTGAEVVQVIGAKAILYKKNPEKQRIVLPK